ncbi:hypothetical protein EDD17DRAFT_1505967 [Pisolithus thermaeus]|nr:hypothetical protein EDD17DRAFT_1505967 [Pisolithus thermaeus]
MPVHERPNRRGSGDRCRVLNAPGARSDDRVLFGLKIKCDKQIPCQSCRRRGCVALCPNGSLFTGLGTRYDPSLVVSRPVTKARYCSERNQQLESALSELQALHSTEPHPPLRPDPLGASQPEDDAGPPSASDPVIVEHPPGFVEVMATLSVSDSGTSCFFGPTAGSHIDNALSQDFVDDSYSESPELPQEIENLKAAFLFKSTHSTLNMDHLVDNYLPTWERALYLTEAYVAQTTYFRLLPAYYVNGIPHVMQVENPHQLGLLFVIFATAALLYPNQEPGSAGVEAESYHKAARSAICLRSVMQKSSLETIQVLHLLSVYNAVSGNELAGKETSMETSWSLVVLAAHLAHTAIRSARTSRRMIFWDLVVADVWNLGGLQLFPFHILIVNSLEAGRQMIRCRCPSIVSAPPSYSTILKLGREVRDFPVTEAAENFAAAACDLVPAKPADNDIGLMESMAIIENPINPLNSPYTPSFLAAYRASLTILRTVKVQCDLHPKPTARLSPIWTSAFSATVVFGMIVMRGPRSAMASSAMKELHDACLLYSKVSSLSRRARRALPIITRLTEKAHNALLHARDDIPYELGQQWCFTDDEGDKDVAIFAGRLKILPMKTHTTDGMLSTPTLASQHKQNQAEAVVLQPYGGEELRSTLPQQSGFAASPERTLGVPNSERTPYPGASSQSAALLLMPHVPTQVPVEPMVMQAYSGGKLSSTWFQQSGFAAGLGQTQEMPTWDRVLCADAPSNSTLTQPSVPLQISPYVPLRASEHGELAAGSSTSAWPLELSNPYPVANVSTPYALAHPQGFCPSHDRSLAQTCTITRVGLHLIRQQIRVRIHHRTYIIQCSHLPGSINPHTRIHLNPKLYRLPRPNSPNFVLLHKGRCLINVGYRSCVNPVSSMGNGYKVPPQPPAAVVAAPPAEVVQK